MKPYNFQRFAMFNCDDLRQGFRTGDRNYIVEQAWEEWQQFCAKWGRYYRSIRRRGEDASYKAYFIYLNYNHRKRLPWTRSPT